LSYGDGSLLWLNRLWILLPAFDLLSFRSLGK
jgi:hypothetical protein